LGSVRFRVKLWFVVRIVVRVKVTWVSRSTCTTFDHGRGTVHCCNCSRV